LGQRGERARQIDAHAFLDSPDLAVGGHTGTGPRPGSPMTRTAAANGNQDLTLRPGGGPAAEPGPGVSGPRPLTGPGGREGGTAAPAPTGSWRAPGGGCRRGRAPGPPRCSP